MKKILSGMSLEELVEFTNSIDDLSKLIPTVHFVENNGGCIPEDILSEYKEYIG